MNAYFDTSAIVKLVVNEDGSAEAGALWDASDVAVTSRLAYAEARVAITSAVRGGRLSRQSLTGVKLALEDRFQELDLIEVTDDVVRNAGDLAEEHALRGYDAVHLASALAMGPDGLVLATWDEDLARAGRRVGLGLAGIGVD